jgi:hypothetical protein
MEFNAYYMRLYSDELYLIYKFKDHYINRTDIGNEYFQGDVSSMVKLIHEYSLNDDNVFEQE